MSLKGAFWKKQENFKNDRNGKKTTSWWDWPHPALLASTRWLHGGYEKARRVGFGVNLATRCDMM